MTYIRPSVAPSLALLVFAACGSSGRGGITSRQLDDERGSNSTHTRADAGRDGDAGGRVGSAGDEPREGEPGDGDSSDGDSSDGDSSDGDSSDGEANSAGDDPDREGDSSGGPRFDCRAAASPQFDDGFMAGYQVSKEVTSQVEETLSLMSPAQKASQMTGVDGTTRDYRDIQRGSDVAVAGLGTIRGFRYRDAGRGVNLDAGQDNRADDQKNFATAFPSPSARAASWDLALERRIGAAIGDETAASKNNVLLAPVVNIVRHPFWGRTQESYGEDPYHVGRMATAFTVGVQEYVAACAKHLLGNNIEKGRSQQDARMTEQTLREIYGRHFEMVVQDAGVACVMASYNRINGVKSTQNRHLLREVLKAPIDQGGMGFEGFVVTDWWAMPGDQTWPDAATAQAVALEALAAGTDIEMPWTMHYYEGTLANADQELVDEAAARVLTQKYRFKSALDTDGWSLKAPSSTLEEGSIAPNSDHEALAEEALIKSAVLLSNGLDSESTVLPLSGVSTIAVVGPEQDFRLVSSSVPRSCVGDEGFDSIQATRECTFSFATDPALGDRATSRVNVDNERAVGPFQGILEVAGSARKVSRGSSVEDALDADAVVVVVGYTPADEGEEYPIADGGDRDSLGLPPGHNELVQDVLDLNKPTVIVVESGSVVNLPWLSHANQNQATIWVGYPGMRGGLALGKLIFGEANFSGKLPMAWPAEAELPPFRDTEDATAMGYFFGYREFDRRRYVEGASVELVFPFGHGLSYSTFSYSALTLPCDSVTADAVFNVSVDIKNTSAVDGDEIAMLFVKPPPKPQGTQGERPWKELKSFARVAVPAGKTVTAELPLRIRDLRRWEGGEDGRWVIDSGEYSVLVGASADDAETSAPGTLRVEAD